MGKEPDEEEIVKFSWSTAKPCIGVIVYFFVANVVYSVILACALTLRVLYAAKSSNCLDKGAANDTWMSNTSWPFSIMLLWAPFLDGYSLFGWKKYHRRCYMCVSMIVISILLVVLSILYKSALSIDGKCPNGALTFSIVLPLYFVSTVFMINLQGYGILMLQGPNIFLVAIIQTAGNIIGNSAGQAGIIFFRQYIEISVIFLFLAGCALVLAFIAATQLEEKIPEDKELQSPIESYKQLLLMILNKRVLVLLLLIFTFNCGTGGIIGNTIALNNRGISPTNQGLNPLVTFIPSILSVYISGVVASKSKPLQKFTYLFPFYIVGMMAYFSMRFLAPYVQGSKCDVHGHVCKSRHDWVVTMYYVVDCIQILFGRPAVTLVFTHANQVTPTSMAGTFSSAVQAAYSTGTTAPAAVANQLFIAAMNKNIQCNANSDYYGPEVFTNSTTGETTRFCGTFSCKSNIINNTVLRKKETGFCNPLGDGYNIVSMITLLLCVLFWIIYTFLCKKFLDVEKEKYDPKNGNESLLGAKKASDVVEPRYSSLDDGDDDSGSYHAI
eukprot:g863.t1